MTSDSDDLCSVSIVKLFGKLWEPSETRVIKDVVKVVIIHLPPDDFPFSVYSDSFELNFKGDHIIYRDIDATDAAFRTAETSVNNESTTKATFHSKAM